MAKDIKGLVMKPQFDSTVFTVGKPVRLTKNKSAYNYESSNISKFNTGDFGLIQNTQPLSIAIRLVNDKIATIPVEAVADGSIEIEVLG